MKPIFCIFLLIHYFQLGDVLFFETFISLQEYTEKGILNDCITPSEALLQAVCGLEHLHSLHIGKFFS